MPLITRVSVASRPSKASIYIIFTPSFYSSKELYRLFNNFLRDIYADSVTSRDIAKTAESYRAKINEKDSTKYVQKKIVMFTIKDKLKKVYSDFLSSLIAGGNKSVGVIISYILDMKVSFPVATTTPVANPSVQKLLSNATLPDSIRLSFILV